MSLAKKYDNWTMDTISEYVAEIVAKESGNVLGENQKSMVINRLNKRLIDLGGLTAQEYYDHLKNNYESESDHLVTILTTHHTFFFREFSHFEYLRDNLDGIVNEVKKRGDNTIHVLSAACSRGQEVYSMAMFFNHHLQDYPGIKYKIVGADIDSESVKIAKNGVYKYAEIKSVPQIYINGNWQRGTGEIANFVKVKSHLKDNCEFGTMNLLSPSSFLRTRKFDVIFCRNVFIYFDLKKVEEIVGSFKEHLHKNALFITGLSESLKTLKIDKDIYAPSVYCFTPTPKETVGDTASKVKPALKSIAKRAAIPKPIRILCVDDSKSVLKLLEKIFSKDEDFEVVGVAHNGVEAEEFIKNNKVDAMTLDIHMPEMDGVEYLKKNFKPGHPHVVVVSSASREDTRYAQETLKHGALDFVEKPALNNIAERAEEIKNKIKMTFLNNNSSGLNNIDKSFNKKFTIDNVEDKSRFLIGCFSDKEKMKSMVNQLEGDQPNIFIFFEGNNNYLNVIKEEFSSLKNVNVFDEKAYSNKGHVYICDLKNDFDSVMNVCGKKMISTSIFGIMSNQMQTKLMNIENGQILLEDTGKPAEEFRDIVNDVFPWTSFPHVGTEYLSGKE